jgi:hypothetical protein
MYHQLQLKKLCILPTQCIYVFYVHLRINSDYLPIHHSLIGWHNRDGVFTARYGLHIDIVIEAILTDSRMQ